MSQDLETQREGVPRVDTGELDTALAFLRFGRACVLKKLAGLDEPALRQRLVASDTTLLWLVQHLTVGEEYWFGHVVGGGHPGRDWDFDGAVPADRTASEVVATYRAACAASDAVILAVGDPDARTAEPVDDAPKTLRWVLAHMGTEVARHAGHADILRELVDGTTGR